MSTTSASAASWHVNGTELGKLGATFQKTATIAEQPRLEGFGPTIECNGVEFHLPSIGGSWISAPAGGKVGFAFDGCGTVSGTCSLKSTTIQSEALEVEATTGTTSPEDVVVLRSTKAGAPVAKYVFVGASCALSGEVLLTGQIKVSMPRGREELVEQPFNFDVKASSDELKWESAPMSLRDEARARLSSGPDWSFR